MGQRLNIEITDGEKLLANCYYHWAAYTLQALNLTHKIVTVCLEKFGTCSDADSAVRLLAMTGAGFNVQEKTRIKLTTDLDRDLLLHIIATSRNNGLISITEKGMTETQKWANGRVTIDMRNRTVDFAVFNQYGIDKDYAFATKYLPECKYDLSHIPFENLDEVMEFIKHNDHLRCRYGNDIIEWI